MLWGRGCDAPAKQFKFECSHFCLVSSGAPSDSYYGNGLMGQRVIVVPSQDLVIVRLGLNYNDDFDQVCLLALFPAPII
jgi:hypothetical protein